MMDELLQERYDLCRERIDEIIKDNNMGAPYVDYFNKTAMFIKLLFETLDGHGELGHSHCELAHSHGEVGLRHCGVGLRHCGLDPQSHNQALYEDVLPANYDNSYANPDYANEKLGADIGSLLCFLYTQVRGMIVFAFEKRYWDFTIITELFIQIYVEFAAGKPQTSKIKEIIVADINDYCDDIMEYRVKEMVDPSLTFAIDIIMDSDLTNQEYLYWFGEYISDNELAISKFLNTLSKEDIKNMARTYTNGYKMGFENNGLDLNKKTTVNIRYCLGFELIVREAIRQFYDMGLEPVIYRCATHTINKRQHSRIGYTGAVPNKQFDYDHRGDAAIYLNDKFVSKKLRALQNGFEEYKELAKGHAGPAVMEVFGEVPFTPLDKDSAYTLGEKQQKMQVHYDNEASQIINRYIPGEERSFTIIAYPTPEIGDKFTEIFSETVRINTLDYRTYQEIQQNIIDVLDTGTSVHIKGSGDNQTDLRVKLYELTDPKTQTIFENCVADVNIPVGEVFTSPVLKGTNGILHVSKVYLNELEYRNLKITFTDGMITDYSCGNFAEEDKNKAFIKENLLHHHDSLPMGEFAIGTNTTAYVMAQKYQITDKLPILIAEKMGPHFAVGDTCFSWSEDTSVYNRDGKEVMARENEISAKRKEDVSKAYFGCHTDITIPYDELESICVERSGGETITIIEKGRFVLQGTKELNKPFGDCGSSPQ